MKRFEVGARVMEPTYGLGSVIAVEDAYTRVQFDEHGVKKFLTSMSKLEPSDEPAPAGARGRQDPQEARDEESRRGGRARGAGGRRRELIPTSRASTPTFPRPRG